MGGDFLKVDCVNRLCPLYMTNVHSPHVCPCLQGSPIFSEKPGWQGRPQCSTILIKHRNTTALHTHMLCMHTHKTPRALTWMLFHFFPQYLVSTFYISRLLTPAPKFQWDKYGSGTDEKVWAGHSYRDGIRFLFFPISPTSLIITCRQFLQRNKHLKHN